MTPQSERELMVEFGKYIMISGFISIGAASFASAVAEKIHDSIHIDAAKHARAAYANSMKKVALMARRASFAMGDDDNIDASLTSIMSDMQSKWDEMDRIFTSEPLGYFAEVFRNIPKKDPEAHRNTLVAIIVFAQLG